MKGLFLLLFIVALMLPNAYASSNGPSIPCVGLLNNSLGFVYLRNDDNNGVNAPVLPGAVVDLHILVYVGCPNSGVGYVFVHGITCDPGFYCRPGNDTATFKISIYASEIDRYVCDI